MKIRIIAKPSAKRGRIEKVDVTTYRVSVKEAPEKGEANQAILKALSEYFHVTSSQIRLLSGAASKYKFIVVDKL
jgi:uncharacterized protein YggU (UPF0235/DUF167 family)